MSNSILIILVSIMQVGIYCGMIGNLSKDIIIVLTMIGVGPCIFYSGLMYAGVVRRRAIIKFGYNDNESLMAAFIGCFVGCLVSFLAFSLTYKHTILYILMILFHYKFVVKKGIVYYMELLDKDYE